MDEEVRPAKRHKNLFARLSLVLFVVCLLALGASLFFYKKYQAAQGTGGPAQAEIVEKISRTIQLPNETPTLMTIADKRKLSNATLAARVEDRDLLLIFGQAKRLVIYRPSSGKVIDMLTFSDKSELPANANPPPATSPLPTP